MTEVALIKRIQHILGPKSSGVSSGIGDDTAVLFPLRAKLLWTVDMLVEGVHFDLSLSHSEEVGRKALAVNLSDIAAMGGIPLFALVSLALPKNQNQSFIDSFYRGMKKLAIQVGVQIVGGNLTRTPGPVVIDVSVLGKARKRVFLRSIAKPGDLLFVTGPLGDAAAGLSVLKHFGKEARKRYPKLVRRFLTPEPRLKHSQLLSGNVHAVIDGSDGPSVDLSHLAKASSVDIILEQERLPLSSEMIRASKDLGKDPLEWALHGGEDYELWVTARRHSLEGIKRHLQSKGCGVHIVGEVRRGSGQVWLRNKGKERHLERKGWDSFCF